MIVILLLIFVSGSNSRDLSFISKASRRPTHSLTLSFYTPLGYHHTVLQKIPANIQANRRDNDVTEFDHEVGTAFIHFGKHIHGAR